jgi:hypothetical protein
VRSFYYRTVTRFGLTAYGSLDTGCVFYTRDCTPIDESDFCDVYHVKFCPCTGELSSLSCPIEVLCTVSWRPRLCQPSVTGVRRRTAMKGHVMWRLSLDITKLTMNYPDRNPALAYLQPQSCQVASC